MNSPHSPQQAMSFGDRLHYGALLLIVLLAIAIRLSFLTLGMRSDESNTFLRYASKPYRVIVTEYTTPNNHILHTLLVRLAYQVFGRHEWAFRLPAVIAGILVIPATYLAIRLLYSKEAGLLAAAMAAGVSQMVEYSTNARGYTMVVLFFLLMLAVAVYLVHHDCAPAWAMLAILAALGAYTVPIMLYSAGMVLIWLGLSIVVSQHGQARRRALLRLIASAVLAGVVTALLYAPIILQHGLSALTANHYVKPLSWADFLKEGQLELWELWRDWRQNVPAWLVALLGAGFLASLALHRRIARHPVPLAVAAVLWIPPLVLVQRVAPGSRVWLFLLPLVSGMAWAGLMGLFSMGSPRLAVWGRKASVVVAPALVLLLCVGILTSEVIPVGGRFPGAQAAANYLKDYVRPGDQVLPPDGGVAPLHYYFDLYGIPLKYLAPNLRDPSRILVVTKEVTGPAANDVLWLREAKTAGYGAPRLVKTLDQAAVYELIRDAE